LWPKCGLGSEPQTKQNLTTNGRKFTHAVAHKFMVGTVTGQKCSARQTSVAVVVAPPSPPANHQPPPPTNPPEPPTKGKTNGIMQH